MEEDLTILFPPEKANREASAQLSPGGLIANASFESGTDDMQFSLGHGSFESEKEPIVKESRMVEPIFIADLSVGDAAQIEEPIPIGIIAGYSGDFDGENKADVTQGHLCGHHGEAMALGSSRARTSEVLVDNFDLRFGPT
jgi:hypothetical protein